MMTRPQDPDETIPALAYKRALVPVLKTLLKMLDADALFLWELFDEEGAATAKNYQKMSKYEKDRLCVEFYRFLVEKQKSIIQDLISVAAPTRFGLNSTRELGPEHMREYLAGRHSILKFIEGVTSDKGLRPLSFDFGEEARPRKYVVLYQEVAEELSTVRPRPRSDPFHEEPSENPFERRPVKMEGLTAFHVRTNTPGVYSRDSLSDTYQDISIGLNYDRIILERTRGGPQIDRCEHLCVLPIEKDGRAIGVLKAESYDPARGFDPSTAKAKNVERCLDFLGEFIIKSREGVDALTYAKLCKGSRLADHLISTCARLSSRGTEEMDSAVETLLNAAIHLFNVFNRRTYIGWEEISGRINHYVDKMCPVLGLPKLDILGRFQELGRYDELLLRDIPQYREHFIHQFHTFILGLLVILEIGIKEFKKWANNQLGARSRVFNKHHKRLDDRSVIRIWFLTCFFHDYTYILQQFDNVMGSFIKKILGLDRLIIDNDWSQVFTEKPTEGRGSKRTQFSRYLLELATYFVSGEQEEDEPGITTHPKLLVDEMWNSVITRQDHGPLSALVLLDSLLGFEITHLNQVNEAYMAALAVACHHKEVFKQVASVGGESFLTLEGFPFIFLLVYCDTAQEWGRRKKGKKGIEYTSPVLESVEVRGRTTQKEVNTTICYDSSGDPNRIPNKPFIRSIEADTVCSFKSRDYIFLISYLQRDFKDSESVPISIADIRFPMVGPRK